MAGGDDDYGEVFKKAKLEHEQQLEAPLRQSGCRRKPMQTSPF
jgi:hypothetical protein